MVNFLPPSRIAFGSEAVGIDLLDKRSDYMRIAVRDPVIVGDATPVLPRRKLTKNEMIISYVLH